MGDPAGARPPVSGCWRRHSLKFSPPRTGHRTGETQHSVSFGSSLEILADERRWCRVVERLTCHWMRYLGFAVQRATTRA